MDTAAVDFPALAIGIVISLVITAAHLWADRGIGRRRSWMVSVWLAFLLLALGLTDLLRQTPREIHVAAVFVGVALPVLGSQGIIHATRRVRPVLRWPIALATTFVLLFGGLLIGAAVVPRYLP